jgi:hypothetical protein
MTDPFKNQRYSSSSSSNLLNRNNESPIVYSQQLRQQYPIDRNENEPSIRTNKSYTQLLSVNDVETSLKQQDAFIESHFHSNKETIKQLKSNIELLFKGTRIVGQLVFYPFTALRWQCQVTDFYFK